jgi:hypothetical protein
MRVAGASGAGRMRSSGSGGRRVWRRASWWLAAVVVVLAGSLALSSAAVAADCSLADYDYNGACGPEYESPSWGNAAGWTDPSQYSTIQLADITGNGQDELLARNSDGLEIWTFDTTLGQWRPAIGANGLPEVLRDFRSPTPSEPVDSQGANPEVYSTIQAADVLGNGTESIVAQFPDGVHVHDYVPPAGTKSINGGTWHEEPVGGPVGAGMAPSTYLSMHVIGPSPSRVFTGGGIPAQTIPATLIEQGSYYFHAAAGGWDGTGQTTNAPDASDPKYYLDNKVGAWPGLVSGANVFRTADGVAAQFFDYNSCGLENDHYVCTGIWNYATTPPTAGHSPFPDTTFGADPSNYETLRMATDLRGPGDGDAYVLGRTSDGLHTSAWGWDPTSGWGWDSNAQIQTLPALADPPGGSLPPGDWSSIRTGDLTGDGHTDVVALVNGQLKAWELKLVNQSRSVWGWAQLPADVPLNLGKGWENNASYYSTIQVGPVAGPGYPDAVIARGPFGIRTWFYCTGGASPVPACSSMQGNSGWTSWLPQSGASYPQFSGGEAAAWTELNNLAHNPPPPANPLIASDESSVRGVWTATNPPSTDQLTTLSNGLALLGGCSGETSANPPTYVTCTPPTGSSFAASDWTAVINETLADIYAAQQVLTYYANLSQLRTNSFLAEGATLPAISNSFAALQGAAGNTTTLSPLGLMSTGLGIAGSLAGVLLAENPVAAAALGIASYIVGAIPSATPELDGPSFQGTLADLQAKFAGAVTDENNAEIEQSSEVRNNWGLLRLVGGLTAPNGAWHNIDFAGLQSATEEGYTLYVYQKLLPTMFDRYVIRLCAPTGMVDSPQGKLDFNCSSNFNGVPGEVTDPATQGLFGFTMIGSPPSGRGDDASDVPCYFHDDGGPWICDYDNTPPADIADQVWGRPSDTCQYNGTALTLWRYDCSLGVSPANSTAVVAGEANGWNFTTCTGTPIIDPFGSFEQCSASGAATSDGSLQLSVSTTLLSGFHVESATLPADHVLYEPGHGDLLSRSHGDSGDGGLTSGGPGDLGAIQLTVTKGGQLGGSGGELLSSSPKEPEASLTVDDDGLAVRQSQPTTLDLKLTGVNIAVPAACQQVPASVSLASPQFTLETSLELSDGDSTRTVTVPTQWECVRNDSGDITELRTVKPQTPAQRPGLAVSITGPQKVTPGSRATYTVRLQNTRRGPRDRTISSLWNVLTQAGLNPSGSSPPDLIRTRLVVRRISELRRGDQKTLRIQIDIPAGASTVGGVCVSVLATADSARPASAQACPTIAEPPVRRG